MTPAGRWLEQNYPYNQLVNTVGKDTANEIWDGLATRFAQNASGETNAFVYGMRGNPEFPEKTYLRIEKPILDNNLKFTKSLSMSDHRTTSGSDPYERFRRSFIEHSQRDGPDVRMLDELDSADRTRAEQLLLARVGESVEAMSGLAHLKSQAAIEPLRTVMRGRSGAIAVRAAIALWKIAADEEAYQMLCRTLERRPLLGHRSERTHAAAMLGQIPRPTALAVLIDVLGDRDVAVRANAMQSVVRRLRLNAEVDAFRSGQLTLAEFQAIARAALAHGEPL